MKYSCYKHNTDAGIEKQSLLREIIRLACTCSKITHHVAPYPLILASKLNTVHSTVMINKTKTLGVIKRCTIARAIAV